MAKVLTKDNRVVVDTSGRVVTDTDACVAACCDSSRFHVAVRCDIADPENNYPVATDDQPPRISFPSPFRCSLIFGDPVCEIWAGRIVLYNGYCYRVEADDPPLPDVECPEGFPHTPALNAPATDPRVVDSVRVERAQIACDREETTCPTSMCVIPDPDPCPCQRGGIDCGDVPPGKAECTPCDCECGQSYTLSWTGFVSGEEYATTNACGPDTNPCAGLACSGNLLADGSMTWSIQARVYCDRSSGFPVARAYIVHQDIAIQQRVYPGRCRCPDDNSQLISYFGVLTNDEDGLLRSLGVMDAFGVVPGCPNFDLLGRIPSVDSTFINGAVIGINCAGGPWGPLEVLPFDTCNREDHQNTGSCGFTRDYSSTLVKNCRGGTALATDQTSELPCPGLRPGGLRTSSRHDSRMVVTPTMPCAAAPIGTGGFL